MKPRTYVRMEVTAHRASTAPVYLVLVMLVTQETIVNKVSKVLGRKICAVLCGFSAFDK